MGELTPRLMERIAIGGPDECWLWLGPTDHKGYGVVAAGRVTRILLGERRGEPLYWDRGDKDACELACHHCDNPTCCNLAHLYVGTYSSNQHDRVERGTYTNANMVKTHCKRGHEFSVENTRLNPRGERVCRTCDRELQLSRRGSDGTGKNSLKTHCKQGHEFTVANTYYRPSGGRNCRTCQRKEA